MRCPVACLLALCFASASQAVIVDNATYTTDTSSSLDWLDLTATEGLSYNDVVAQFGAGGTFSGWRHSTAGEVEGLFTSFGLPVQINEYFVFNQPQHADLVSRATSFSSLFGDTVSNGLRSFGSIGYAGYSDPAGTHQGFGVTFLSNTHLWLYTARDSEILDLDDSTGSPNGGHFLVRTAAPVPLPAAAWLLLVGLGGLGAAARRRRSSQSV